MITLVKEGEERSLQRVPSLLFCVHTYYCRVHTVVRLGHFLGEDLYLLFLECGPDSYYSFPHDNIKMFIIISFDLLHFSSGFSQLPWSSLDTVQ